MACCDATDGVGRLRRISEIRSRITRPFPPLGFASVDPRVLPCETACGPRRYTRTVALAYYPPRCLACTRPVEISPVTKRDLDLRDDDDWINAEVDSDRTPRFLAEFRAWTRRDEPSEEVAQAVKWGWPVPSPTVH